MKFMSKISVDIESHILKTVVPIALRGAIVPSGTLIDVSKLEAVSLKSRGAAVDATEDEYSAAEKVLSSGTVIDDSQEIIRLLIGQLRSRAPEFYNAKAAYDATRDLGR